MTAIDGKDEMKTALLACRWPGGDRFDGITSRVAEMCAEQLTAQGWTRIPVNSAQASRTEEIDLATIEIGDIVRSRWSSTGALWRVTEVGPISTPAPRQRDRRILQLQSVKSGRTDSRGTYDLVKVVTA